ncbi:DUF4377 domain-containing protein [Algibacter pacificus]|uniref:DUF4377 domain-containing protein n=1 Tax=Algibacter pacificus TaxID=2599389 RepID=UPI0011C6F941|nr:DUF4377 domain-containing protein [Algibacter pacificus]
MKKATLLIVLLSLLYFSCSDNEHQTTVLYWVDSERVTCTGIDKQTCYRIQEPEVINDDAWQYLYSGIEGFDHQYETGYVYRISVFKSTIKNPPADGSSIRYVLNEVISKTAAE